MDRSEKKYACKRIEEIAQDKTNTMWNEHNASVQDIRVKAKKSELGDHKVRENALKATLKAVKPAFRSVADIKKDAIEKFSRVIVSRSLCRCGVTTYPDKKDGSCGYCGKMQERQYLPILSNKGEIEKAFKSIYKEMCEAECKKYDAIVNSGHVTDEDGHKKAKAIRDAKTEVLDAIMLGDSEEAVKMIAKFTKKTF